jgi:hypothetical protein
MNRLILDLIFDFSPWREFASLSPAVGGVIMFAMANGKEGVMAWALTQLPLRVELTPSSTGAR